MNAKTKSDLLTKLCLLIANNDHKLEALVEALESVCREEGIGDTTTVAPEAKHPLEDYTISEKDIGALVFIDGKVSPKPVTHFMLDDKYVFNNREGIWYKDDFKPYTDSIKLHFKPHYATEGSSAPSELVEGEWFAVLFANGSIVCSLSPNYWDWGSTKPAGGRTIIGYQTLSFVNPILG